MEVGMESKRFGGAKTILRCVRCDRLSAGDGQWVRSIPGLFDFSEALQQKNICSDCSRRHFPQFYTNHSRSVSAAKAKLS
jgi:hypothetical protein